MSKMSKIVFSSVLALAALVSVLSGLASRCMALPPQPCVASQEGVPRA